MKYNGKMWPVIFLVFICLGFFYQTFTKGWLPVPSDALVGLYHPWRDKFASEFPRGVPFKNFLITDPVRQQIPWRKIAIDQWKEGKVPWWNPYAFSGTPLLANIQAAVFYPLNILFFLFDFPLAWTILIILQPIFAAIFFYIYCRSRNISDYASLFGAVAWSFCGFMIAWLTWGTIVHAALWLPLILLAIDKNKFWLLIFALSIHFFAGHAQISLYISVLAILYALYSKKFTRRFLFSLLIAAAITSIQWIPFIQLFQLTSRSVALSNSSAPGWLMPWYQLVQFFAPDFFGNPATLNYWGEWNYGEFIGYIGVIPLLFVFYGAFTKFASFWRHIVIGSLLLLINHPITLFIYGLGMPIISTLQPTRLMVLVDFSLVMLAALGIEQWFKDKKPNLKPIAILCIVYGLLWLTVFSGRNENFFISQKNLILPTATLLVGALLYFVKNKKVALLVMLIVTIFDLFRFGWKFTPFTPREYFFPETETIKYLEAQPKPFRVMIIDDRILPPNVSAFYKIETINGYDPLIPAAYEAFMRQVESRKDFNRIIVAKNIELSILPYLNVKYVITLDEIQNINFRLVFSEGLTKIYEYNLYKPRVFFEPENKGLINITNHSEGNISFNYSVDQDASIFISELNADGWTANLDGISIPTFPLQLFEFKDATFRVIKAPAGTHEVKFTYN